MFIRFAGILGLTSALIVHGAALAYLFLATPPRPERSKVGAPRKITTVRTLPTRPVVIAAKRVEPPPTVSRPEPPKKPPRQKKSSPQSLPTPTPSVEPVPVVVQETPPSAPAAAPAPAVPRRFSVSLEATVQSGGIAVPTSQEGWTFGTPDGSPEGQRRPAGSVDQPARAAEVTALPRLLGMPPLEDLRRAYPEQARRDGREADVKLEVLVSDRGSVLEVRILQSAGPDFDQAAKALVRRFRFSPGNRGGAPVTVWLPWTYKFRLDG